MSQVAVTPSVRDLILAALDAEEEEPQESLKLYQQAKQRNREFSGLVFITSLAAPLFASILAVRLESGILRFCILAFFGLGVPVMLRGTLDRRHGVKSRLTGKEPALLLPFLGGAFLFVKSTWLVLTALIFTVLALGPFVPWALVCIDSRCAAMNDPEVVTALGAACLAIFGLILLMVWADIRMDDLTPPRDILKIFAVSLFRNRLEVAQYLSALAAGFVVASLESTDPVIAPSSTQIALIGGGLSGLFLALSLARGDLSSEVSAFIHLGTSRCHMRLQRWVSARVILRPVDQDDICECFPPNAFKTLCQYLCNDLWLVVEGVRLRFHPRDPNDEAMRELAESELPDKAILLREIEANQRAIKAEETQAALHQATNQRRSVGQTVLSVLGKLYWGTGIVSWIWWVLQR